jgi:hypothetical protein
MHKQLRKGVISDVDVSDIISKQNKQLVGLSHLFARRKNSNLTRNGRLFL